MGFQAEIQADVAAAFVELGDLARPVTLKRAGAYTPLANGSFVMAETISKFKAILTGFSLEQQRLGDIRHGDQQCLVPSKSIAFTPALNDKLVDGQITYDVVGVEQDPAKAHYALHLRLSGGA